MLGAPFDARTRVHEYGGGAWAVTEDARLVYAEYSDQRLYVVEDGHRTALTPDTNSQVRYGDLSVRDHEVWCVRESHDGEGTIVRDIVAIRLDGASLRSVVSGSDFLAYPRVSPDGTQLAWIAWDHPQMPWDGTELRVAPLVPTGWPVSGSSSPVAPKSPCCNPSGRDPGMFWRPVTGAAGGTSTRSMSTVASRSRPGAVAADIGAPFGSSVLGGTCSWAMRRVDGPHPAGPIRSPDSIHHRRIR